MPISFIFKQYRILRILLIINKSTSHGQVFQLIIDGRRSSSEARQLNRECISRAEVRKEPFLTQKKRIFNGIGLDISMFSNCVIHYFEALFFFADSRLP